MNLDATARPQTGSLISEQVLDGHALRLFEPFTQLHQAPHLFMLHGLEESWQIWLDAGRLLADQFRVFCLELPWNGRQGHAWGHTQSAAEWVHQALEMAPAAPTILVAHSLGANAVLEYLQKDEIVGLQAVVLVSPFYRSDYKELDWNLFSKSQQIFRQIMSEGLRVRQGSKELEPSLLSAMADKVQEFIGPLGFIEFLTLFMRTPSLKFEHINLPVLVVGGAHDPGSTPAANEALAAALPQGQFKLIPDCGHFCMLTHGPVLSELIQDFLLPAPFRQKGTLSLNGQTGKRSASRNW